MVKCNVEIGTNKGGPQIAPFGREFCSLCNAYQFFMANHFHQLPTIFKGESPTPTWINQHKDGQFLLNILDKGKEIYIHILVYLLPSTYLWTTSMWQSHLLVWEIFYSHFETIYFTKSKVVGDFSTTSFLTI